MFDDKQPYERKVDPVTGKALLVQGTVSCWEGSPPSDWFATPDWAKPGYVEGDDDDYDAFVEKQAAAKPSKTEHKTSGVDKKKG